MSSKLTDKQKIEIVEKYSTGKYTCASLGREYCVSGSSINSLLRRRNVAINSDPSSTRRQYSLNEHYFDIIDTENKAYWLGWMYSDGCNDKNSISISLQEEDREILEQLARDIDSTRPLVFISNNNKKDGYIRKPQWKIDITSKHMHHQLIKLGCPPAKSLILTFPNEKQVPNHLLKHWLRGMWDGDGTFCHWIGKSNLKYEHFHLESSIVGTENICYGIKDFIFNETGILTRVKAIKNKLVKRLKITKILDIYNFMLWLYSDCTIYMNRKYNKCNEIERLLYNSKRITGPIFFTN